MQSATDPPKKLALGERAIMADGGEYNLFQSKETGGPVELIYPPRACRSSLAPTASSSGRPTRTRRGCSRCHCFTPECQQLIVDFGGLRSMHALVKEKVGSQTACRDQAHAAMTRPAWRE